MPSPGDREESDSCQDHDPTGYGKQSWELHPRRVQNQRSADEKPDEEFQKVGGCSAGKAAEKASHPLR